MNKTSAAAVLAAATIMTVSAASPSTVVNASPYCNRHWMTVFTNEVPLHWNWNASATSARLEIAGMNGAVTTNFASVTSNWIWQAFASNTPSSENVCDLRLTFYSGGGAVVGALTSRLAVVTGAFGKTVVIPTAENIPWPKLKENVVISYDAGWAATTDGATNGLLVIAKTGGAAQTNALADAGGYYGWKIKRSDWGYGTFNLALTFPGRVGEWDATLIRQADGTLIRMQ